jgi:hypothetical protein
MPVDTAAQKRQELCLEPWSATSRPGLAQPWAPVALCPSRRRQRRSSDRRLDRWELTLPATQPARTDGDVGHSVAREIDPDRRIPVRRAARVRTRSVERESDADQDRGRRRTAFGSRTNGDREESAKGSPTCRREFRGARETRSSQDSRRGTDRAHRLECAHSDTREFLRRVTEFESPVASGARRANRAAGALWVDRRANGSIFPGVRCR